MSNAEFDRHANEYYKQHEQNIQISGEDPEYFAEYKMRDFKSLIVEANLPMEGNYLDFGSGIGASVKPFQRFFPDAKLVCSDVSNESLSLSRTLNGDVVEYAWMRDGKLPFSPARFDGIFACCVFHHIPPDQHESTLHEIRRVLKPGGLLMIYEHNPFNPLTVKAVRNCPFDENAILLSARQLACTSSRVGLDKFRLSYRVFFPAALSKLRPLENYLRWLPAGAQYFIALRA